MANTLFNNEYKRLIHILRDKRLKEGVSQSEVAEYIGSTQSKVSKIEHFERRLDAIELKYFCEAVGINPKSIFSILEKKSKSKK